jgi:hypothetical protein
LFDQDALRAKLMALFGVSSDAVTVYGEAYGGKQQGMSATYGPDLRFIAFDVKIGDNWLSVPKAEAVCDGLGIEFVSYTLIPTDIQRINEERDRQSVQAQRNMLKDQTWERKTLREGIVLRPPFEVTLNNGKRLIAKHKREEFSERASGKDTQLDSGKAQVMEQAEAIAVEWVTAMRLEHVIDKLKGDLQRDPEIQWIPHIIGRMVDDVQRESAGEVVWADPVKKAVSARAVKLFKEYLNAAVQNPTTPTVG